MAIKPIDMECICGNGQEVVRDDTKPVFIRCRCGRVMNKKAVQPPGFRTDHTVNGTSG